MFLGVVELHVLDEMLTVGEWCPHCNLPSAVRLPFVGIAPASCEVVLRAATFACQDCGANWNVDEVPPPEGVTVEVSMWFRDDDAGER